MKRFLSLAVALALIPALAVGLAFAAPVPKAEKQKPATDEERAEVKNNLKEIVLAMLNFESANGFLPGDVVDGGEKLLLSWRVQLLPYLGEVNLWKGFRMDEPWDSENNKELIERMPKIYAPTRVTAKAGETFYRGFGGEGEHAGIFEPGIRLTGVGIPDGASNTIGVIDAGEPVIWTKPGTDLPCDPKKKLPEFGGMIDGKFYCVMCDGKVMTVKRGFGEKALRAAISRASGETFDPKDVFDE